MTLTERLGGLLAPVARAAGVALVAGAAFLAAPAQAATLCPNSGQNLFLDTVTTGGAASLACAANIPSSKPGNGGNVFVEDMNAGDIFGQGGDWMRLGKIDLPGLSGDFLEITAAADRKSGTWSLKSGFVFAPDGLYALVLKAGGANGSVFNLAYLLDTTDPTATSGTWNTLGLVNKGGNQPALSNIQLYGTAAPIPLPAAAWLLIAGLAGLGAISRRKAAAAGTA